MKVSKARSVPTTTVVPVAGSLSHHLRLVVANHVEEILSEVASTLRGLRTFLLVATVSLPLFLVGFVVVMWRLAR